MNNLFCDFKHFLYLCGGKDKFFCMKVAIIGAGAAGCFCAVNLKRINPDAVVEVFEGGSRPLAKVAITGGGRCNLTNSFEGIRNLAEAYPRGDKLMKRMFSVFNNEATMDWFESEGVRLVTQDDNCVFPASQDAMTIVNTLFRGMERSGVLLHTRHKAMRISPVSHASIDSETSCIEAQSSAVTYEISFLVDGEREVVRDFDKVVVTTGGSPKRSGIGFLDELNLEIAEPIPSLFTFNINDPITALMGAVVEGTSVRLASTKFRSSGPLLITHWGMSGPAILKLSSYAARYLAENEYKATLLVNWLGDEYNEQSALSLIQNIIAKNPQKQISSVHPEELTSRMWSYIINKCTIPSDRKLSELSKKHLNVLCATLTNDTYKIEGQSRFKDEFVTCGGVALSNINQNTLEAKQYPGLYFAGEVLDVDAITGGFNLQAAWSMGYVIANEISN